MDTMFDGIGSNCDAYWKCEVAKMRKMNIPTDPGMVRSRRSERKRSCWMQEAAVIMHMNR